MSVTWTPPFTLDISDVEDDISGYCIDVVNINTSSSLFSQCGINATEIDFSLSLDACHIYRITVSPVNVVGQGEGNTLNYSHQIESCMGINIPDITDDEVTNSMMTTPDIMVTNSVMTTPDITDDNRVTILAGKQCSLIAGGVYMGFVAWKNICAS